MVFHRPPARMSQFCQLIPFCPPTMIFSSLLSWWALGAGLGVSSMHVCSNTTPVSLCVSRTPWSLTAKQANKQGCGRGGRGERISKFQGEKRIHLKKMGGSQEAWLSCSSHSQSPALPASALTVIRLPNCRGRSMKQPLLRESCLTPDGFSIYEVTFERHQSVWELHSRWIMHQPGASQAAKKSSRHGKEDWIFFLPYDQS